jgi:hypothetical protein
MGSLGRGVLLLLVLAAILFTFNHARLLARDAAVQRLAASRTQADRVQAEAEAALLADLRRIAADRDVRAALAAGQLGVAASTARLHGLDPGDGLQLLSVDENLRVSTSGGYKRAALWETMRAALEQGEATGIEGEEESGTLAVVAAALGPDSDRQTTTALAIARPLGPELVDAMGRATQTDVSIYTPDGIRRATTRRSADGDRLDGEPAASALWRRWERRQRPFVSATVRRATAVDPVRGRDGGVVAVRELSTPLAYDEGFRRLPGSRRFLLEMLFLGLAALMSGLLGRPARGRGHTPRTGEGR